MNRQSQTTTIIRNFILAIVLLGSSSAAFAQSDTKATPTSKIAVRYLGSEEDMILVGVNYEAAERAKFSLSIYNEDGEVLFRNVYESGKLEKKFKVPKDQGKLTFVFSGAKERRSRSYVIHNNSKMVEDLIVRKID